MKKSLMFPVVAASAVVVALLGLFPEWARRLMRLVRPITETVEPLARLGGRARSSVPEDVAESAGAATDELLPGVT